MNGYSFEIIGTDSETAALPDWYGSVLRFARVGAAICAIWARRQLMSAVFVIRYRKGGKNDGNGAEAICEAGDATEYAACSGQIFGATGDTDVAPGAAASFVNFGHKGHIP